MSYMNDRSQLSNFSKSGGRGNTMNKSNVTLWKSKYNKGIPEDTKKVENDYIENLKKQVHFMEMELKLMKEREKEIEKTGGFTQLFNDDKDPSQHILQLKNKYSNMRKTMENKVDELNNKKKEIQGTNFSLKAQIDTLRKIEKDMYSKLVNLEEKSDDKLNYLENEYAQRNKERLDIEANNRLQEVELKNELQNNQDLEYTLTSNQKLDAMKQEEFDNQLALIENLTKEKIAQYETINKEIKDLENKTNQEPYYKIEFEKNEEYKKKIEKLEKKIHEVNAEVETLEVANDFLVNKKDEVVNKRKKLIQTNDDLKREIESKNQLNEIRIQKKVKDNNSEEIKSFESHLENVKNNINELEKKIEKEIEKSRIFSAEILKLNIDLRHKEEERENVIESVDAKIKELGELRDKVEELNAQYKSLTDKISRESTDNSLLRNRYKIVAEEYASLSSKYNFITNNYDFTTNLKKISMDDLKNLTQTNTLVNSSILNFVDKIGSFKKQNLQNILEKDDE